MSFATPVGFGFGFGLAAAAAAFLSSSSAAAVCLASLGWEASCMEPLFREAGMEPSAPSSGFMLMFMVMFMFFSFSTTSSCCCCCCSRASRVPRSECRCVICCIIGTSLNPVSPAVPTPPGDGITSQIHCKYTAAHTSQFIYVCIYSFVYTPFALDHRNPRGGSSTLG